MALADDPNAQAQAQQPGPPPGDPNAGQPPQQQQQGGPPPQGDPNAGQQQQQQPGGPPPQGDPNAPGGPGGPGAPGSGAAGAAAPVMKSDEDDFGATPFTSYGEVNDSKEEQEEMLFYQYGRLFGVSLGLGAEFVTGNRGALWQGGIPLVDFKLHCWFDFNTAIDIGVFTAQHYYNTTAQSLGYVSINMIHVGVDLKYYFTTQNLSAPISFANPYLLAGAGSYSKTENSVTANSQTTDNSIGIAVGAGLEFVITHRKIYFEIEGKMHFVTFQDTYTNLFQTVGLTDLTGQFLTLSGSFLFTW